jgi:hypothetical protein
MRLRPALLACGLALALTATAARADGPPDPLRFFPDRADVVVKVEQPRRLAEGFTRLDAVRELQKIEAVRELLDSTNARRAKQLLGYLEKQLGVAYFDMIDRVAGGGIAAGVSLTDAPGAALVVVQSKDEDFLKRYVKLALEVLDQELARLEVKDRPQKGTYQGFETVRFSDKLYAAVVGSALLLSNQEKVLHLAIDTGRADGKNGVARLAALKDARRLLPKEPLAWAWLNMERVGKLPQVKAAFAVEEAPKKPATPDDPDKKEPPKNDPEMKKPQTPAASGLGLSFGPWIDAAYKSPFVCAGLCQEGNSYLLSLRVPMGREAQFPHTAMFVPPEGEPGLYPLLEPKGVILCETFYLDLGSYWERRRDILGTQGLKQLEEFDKNSGRFLLGAKLSQLLTTAGTQHRFVLSVPAESGYKVKSYQPVPAFALVSTMRDPVFAKKVDSLLRSASVLANTQVKVKLAEEMVGDVKLVGYRFPEDGKFPNDTFNLRFGFSPCFARVGDYFFVCSTIELGRELIGLLEKEGQGPARGQGGLTAHTRVYSSGIAAALKAGEGQLLTQVVLGQALAPDEARAQVRAFIDLVARLGHIDLTSTYGPREFHYDLRLSLGR